MRALCNGSTPVQCTSLKSNLGHLEAAAAAAGLSSLIVGPLLAGVVAINAQLRGYVLVSFSINFGGSLLQAECAPVVDCVFQAVPDAR